ncbi:MAG: NAD(P)-dependent oxidoreductase [Pseudomonadota bacterium]
MRAGVVGLGDMGSGLAKNLIAGGFATTGYDLSEQRMAALAEMGGATAASVAELGANADGVFVMVMNGDQAKAVILGQPGGAEGLVHTLKPGAVVILSATIIPEEAEAIADGLDGSGILLVDTPVSGGFPGAQSGTLTMMAAGSDDAMERAAPLMAAVSKSIHRVGSRPGMGQTVKACLQALQGSFFAAVCETSAMAAKAGVSGQVFSDVVNSSSAACGITKAALENIIDRAFIGTGSHINTMYKDLTIALDLARALGVPLFTTATAMQLFQAGRTRHPDGDNWVVTRITEEIVGAELTRAGDQT